MTRELGEIQMREVYLVHYLQQSCGWIKIAEYALAPEDVARVQAEIQARHPGDVLRFEVRNQRNIK